MKKRIEERSNKKNDIIDRKKIVKKMDGTINEKKRMNEKELGQNK